MIGGWNFQSLISWEGRDTGDGIQLSMVSVLINHVYVIKSPLKSPKDGV